MLLYTYTTPQPIGTRARSVHVGTPAHVYTVPAARSITSARAGNYTTSTASSLSRLELTNIFLPETVLTKLRNHINRVLKARNKALTSVAENKLVVVTHILAASYLACVSTVKEKGNIEFFFQTRLAPKRYLEVWLALSGSSRSRQRVEALCEGWSNKPVRGNGLITELEQELAILNRSIVCVPGKLFSVSMMTIKNCGPVP